MLALACAFALVAGGPADAAKKVSKKEASQKLKQKQKKAVAKKDVYAPPYASIVVDAKTGKVLSSDSADAVRHPASLTKVMTLYLLFDELERGTLSLNTPLTVSAEASRQAPSKLGLRPGETIKVDDAIKALVTKSANDVAVTVAENISGSESAFAQRMTRKARALGMNSTVYVNASGLPDPDQITTARDLALLGRAIQDNHPERFRYFATRSFTWRGHTFSNHNKLLGSVQGIDGIKTGYVRASGFNLLTSAKSNGRNIVAVVLGGRSGASRDAHMRDLVADAIDKASPGTRTAPLIAAAPMAAEPTPILAVASARANTPAAVAVASAVPTPHPRPDEYAPAVAAASPAAQADVPMPHPAAAALAALKAAEPPPVEPQQVAEVQTVAQPVPQAPAATASIPQAKPAPAPSLATMTPDAIAQRIAIANAAVATTTTPSQDLRWIVGKQPALPQAASAYAGGTTPGSPASRPQQVAQAAPAQQPTQIQVQAQVPVQASLYPAAPVPASGTAMAYAEPEPEPEPVPDEPAAPAAPVAPPRPGWQIQIGATPDMSQAQGLLERASGAVRTVDRKAEPFTEPVEKDGVTLYRARFAGFSERGAAAACKAVKRASLSCFTLRN